MRTSRTRRLDLTPLPAAPSDANANALVAELRAIERPPRHEQPTGPKAKAVSPHRHVGHGLEEDRRSIDVGREIRDPDREDGVRGRLRATGGWIVVVVDRAAKPVEAAVQELVT